MQRGRGGPFSHRVPVSSVTPHWHKELRQVELPADDGEKTPVCVKLHGFLLAPKVPAVISQEPALVYRAGVGIVWTDGSGRNSSDPQH
eukprot:6476609-Amphidinium_carterae.3